MEVFKCILQVDFYFLCEERDSREGEDYEKYILFTDVSKGDKFSLIESVEDSKQRNMVSKH